MMTLWVARLICRNITVRFLNRPWGHRLLTWAIQMRLKAGDYK